MTKGRMEAFSDGVLAIVITIMVLEFHVPESGTWEALRPVLPVFLTYVLSFVFLGVYWNNHHHMLQACDRVNGRVLWANLHLLFWLSLVPFVTAWMGQHYFAPAPTALYGVVLLFCAIAWTILQHALIVEHGSGSKLARAMGKDVKGRLSLLFYVLAIPMAFVSSRFSIALYIVVTLMWLVPDRRIERQADRLESGR
jgi:uncharacterized membrane protein